MGYGFGNNTSIEAGKGYVIIDMWESTLNIGYAYVTYFY